MRSSSFFVLLTAILLSAPPAKADGGAQHQVKQSPPVKMGTSGGSAVDASRLFCCGGTLGCLVMRDGVLCILSNNHILARSGSAGAGEDDVQPGLIDSNCSASSSNVVGDFLGNVVPLGSANVDVGLSVARSGVVDTSGAILDIGVPSSITQNATVGLAVTKSGRTTGQTTGNVTSVNTSVSIQYQKGCASGKKFTISYTNQIVTGAMSAGGDSGSLLVTNNAAHRPVGLLYAGSSSTTIYNPVAHVVSALTAGGHSFSFVGTNAITVAEPKLAQAPSDEDLAQALDVKVQNEQELFKVPGVIGVGVGASENNPLESAIVVYFDNSFAIPTKFPTNIDGFHVRMILTDKFVAQ